MNAAIAFAREPSHVSVNRTEQALARFAELHRPALSRLASRHPRLADLAISFPALLFALAVPRRRFDPEPAITGVIAGKPLAELAAMAHVPLWTRRLNACAFSSPLPLLPDNPAFAKQIANHLPKRPDIAPTWLAIVAYASRWGHDGLAIWYARHLATPNARDVRRVLNAWRLIAAWAWHCAHPETPATWLLTRRWSPEMSCRHALDAAQAWKDGLVSLLALGEQGLPDMWAQPANVDGYTFEPAITPRQLVTAADELENCARSHGADGWDRIWLVRKETKLVAMLSLYAGDVVRLSSIAGPKNARVPDDLSLAAQTWFRTHCPNQITPGGLRGYRPSEWRRVWRPYWLAKKSFPWWLTLATPSYEDWLPVSTWPRHRRRRRIRRGWLLS